MPSAPARGSFLFAIVAIGLITAGSSLHAQVDALAAAPPTLEEMTVTAQMANPTGQTLTTIDRDKFENSPAFSIGQVLQYSPGVSIKQGNGPRDVGISVRGSNARNGFGIRNVQIFEDGFPVTQPDGLSRSDLTDPHAYSGIDVYQGPSSAVYGNYATGGAINFRTRSGGEIDGVDAGIDTGSYGYFNGYATVGHKYEHVEYALFASHVRASQATSTSDFNTTTVNLLSTYTPSPRDTFTIKFIDNELHAHLSVRLSLNQFGLNPYQKGCAVAGPAAASGCAAVTLFANGANGATVAQSAAQAGLGRRDRRTIAGLRWEHGFDDQTTWRTQFVYDVKDISQPTGSTSAKGATPAYNIISDITRRGELFGLPAVHFAGIFFNYESLNSYTYALAPGGNATLGVLNATTFGHHANFGARLREEIQITDAWRTAVAVGAERTDLAALNTGYGYPAAGSPTTTTIRGDRRFLNVAPEIAAFYKPTAQWELHGRIATAYGTPQATNLFVTPAGVNGNNTALRSQTNLGFDAGIDWIPVPQTKVSVTGFYEFLRNELVSQSPGAGLQSFTFNAPRSEHRGIEVAADWHPVSSLGLALSYTFNDQRYTRYSERLSAGANTTVFDRDGNRIPGVEPHTLSARISYEQPGGSLKGLGGYVELNFRDRFFVDNANLVKIPGYTLVNINIHYSPDRMMGMVRDWRIFLEVQNLTDKTYVASANVVSNSINAVTGLQNPASTVMAATGSIYAGAPRMALGGLRMSF